MNKTAPQALDIFTDFAVMRPDKGVCIERADAEVYHRLDRDYAQFAGHELISAFQFSEDWDAWEMHPNGDEVVILMSGRATFCLQMDGEVIRVELDRPGQYAVIPRGVWHTAETAQHACVLFITPGQDTQHKAL